MLTNPHIHMALIRYNRVPRDPRRSTHAAAVRHAGVDGSIGAR